MSASFLSIVSSIFEQLRSQGEKTLAQLTDADVHWAPDSESNSIAVIVQHLHGNMISRFTDFLTTDGEKPTRDRDAEFVEQSLTLADLNLMWQEGWDCVLAAVRPLQESDLQKEIFIRGQSHTVMEALLRAHSHFSMHVGQIVYIGKHRKGEEWKTLSVPKKRVRPV